MSTHISEMTAEATEQDALDAVYDQLVSSGLDKEQVQKFSSQLKSCNITTIGALRAFHASLEELVNTMFDVSTVIGKLQSSGFLAAVRVRSLSHVRPSPVLTACCLLAGCGIASSARINGRAIGVRERRTRFSTRLGQMFERSELEKSELEKSERQSYGKQADSGR